MHVWAPATLGLLNTSLCHPQIAKYIIIGRWWWWWWWWLRQQQRQHWECQWQQQLNYNSLFVKRTNQRSYKKTIEFKTIIVFCFIYIFSILVLLFANLKRSGCLLCAGSQKYICCISTYWFKQVFRKGLDILFFSFHTKIRNFQDIWMPLELISDISNKTHHLACLLLNYCLSN